MDQILRQGGYIEFVIPNKEKKGSSKKKPARSECSPVVVLLKRYVCKPNVTAEPARVEEEEGDDDDEQGGTLDRGMYSMWSIVEENILWLAPSHCSLLKTRRHPPNLDRLLSKLPHSIFLRLVVTRPIPANEYEGLMLEVSTTVSFTASITLINTQLTHQLSPATLTQLQYLVLLRAGITLYHPTNNLLFKIKIKGCR